MSVVLETNRRAADGDPCREMPSSQRLLEKSCGWTPSAKESKNYGPKLLSAGDQVSCSLCIPKALHRGT